MFRWSCLSSLFKTSISFRSATFITLFTQLFLIHLWISWEIVMSWFISQRSFIKYILKYITHIRKNVEILWRYLLEVCLIAISTKRSYKSWLITLFSIHNFMFKTILHTFFSDSSTKAKAYLYQLMFYIFEKNGKVNFVLIFKKKDWIDFSCR